MISVIETVSECSTENRQMAGLPIAELHHMKLLEFISLEFYNAYPGFICSGNVKDKLGLNEQVPSSPFGLPEVVRPFQFTVKANDGHIFFVVVRVGEQSLMELEVYGMTPAAGYPISTNYSKEFKNL